MENITTNIESLGLKAEKQQIGNEKFINLNAIKKSRSFS